MSNCSTVTIQVTKGRTYFPRGPHKACNHMLPALAYTVWLTPGVTPGISETPISRPNYNTIHEISLSRDYVDIEILVTAEHYGEGL